MQFSRGKTTGILCCILVALQSYGADANYNWGQWRGPLGTGASPTANPPLKWTASEGIKWKVKIPGRGTGTPIIWDDQVFVQTALPTEKVAGRPAPLPSSILAAQQQEPPPGQGRRGRGRGGPRGGFGGGEKPSQEHQFTLISVDRQTGKINWQQVARRETPHEGHHADHTFASASPVTDGQQIFAYFGSRGLYAYDLQGNLQWSKDFGDMETKMDFGEGSSPALHGGTIVVNWDHEGEDFIVALDKNTGKELWRQQRDEDTSWGTPLIVEHNGQAQVITAATRKIRAYDLATGKPLWESRGLTPNSIPSPVAGDGMVYLMSGFRGNALYAIRLGRTGDLTDTDAIVWQHQKSTPYVPSPLLYDGKLFFISHNNAILSCLDAKTGQVHYEGERLPGAQGVYASPVAARDRIYIIGRNGTSLVLKNAASVEVLAVNELGEKIDASPALAGQDLFLRGHEHLYCISSQ